MVTTLSTSNLEREDKWEIVQEGSTSIIVNKRFFLLVVVTCVGERKGHRRLYVNGSCEKTNCDLPHTLRLIDLSGTSLVYIFILTWYRRSLESPLVGE